MVLLLHYISPVEPSSFYFRSFSDCRKVIDPACRDLEEECKKEKVTAAARVLAAQRNLNASKDKLQKARDDANTVRVNVPQECKKGLE